MEEQEPALESPDPGQPPITPVRKPGETNYYTDRWDELE